MRGHVTFKLCYNQIYQLKITIEGWEVRISDLFSFRQTVIRKYVREQRRSLWLWLVRANFFLEICWCFWVTWLLDQFIVHSQVHLKSQPEWDCPLLDIRVIQNIKKKTKISQNVVHCKYIACRKDNFLLSLISHVLSIHF